MGTRLPFPYLTLYVVKMDTHVPSNIQLLAINVQTSTATLWAKAGLNGAGLGISVMEIAQLDRRLHTAASASADCYL
jgi:hypothetical protein